VRRAPISIAKQGNERDMAKHGVKKAVAAKPAMRKPAGKTIANSDGLTADTVSAAVAWLTDAIAADRLGEVPADLVQKLMAAAIRAYSAKVQTGEQFLPFHPTAGRVSPTDVMITASGLLKAGDLQVFELGMWQSYTGR
jgi:hypothetical protein